MINLIIICAFIILFGILIAVSFRLFQCNRRLNQVLDYSSHLVFLQDNQRHYDEGKYYNEKRIIDSRISFNAIKFDDQMILIIDDTLDIYNNRGITIYGTYLPLELPKVRKSMEIARIDLSGPEDEESTIFKIERLWVHELYRRKSIGSTLLQRVCEWAELRNVSKLYLTAYSSHDIISQKDLRYFYSLNGFVSTKGNSMSWKNINL